MMMGHVQGANRVWQTAFVECGTQQQITSDVLHVEVCWDGCFIRLVSVVLDSHVEVSLEVLVVFSLLVLCRT